MPRAKKKAAPPCPDCRDGGASILHFDLAGKMHCDPCDGCGRSIAPVDEDLSAVPSVWHAPWRVGFDAESVHVIDRRGACVAHTSRTEVLEPEYDPLGIVEDATFLLYRQIRMLPEIVALLEALAVDPTPERRETALNLLQTYSNPPAQPGEKYWRLAAGEA